MKSEVKGTPTSKRLGNTGIDTTMIRQLSDKDAVTVEVIKGNTKIIAASMYFDRELQIENDLEKNGTVATTR